jgi:plastocyanin domain-containing protein
LEKALSRRLLALLLATAAVGAGLVAVSLWEPRARPVRPAAVARPVVRAGADNRVELSVTERGFEPSPVRVQAGVPVTLVVTRKTEQTCATELVVSGTTLKVPLPLDVPVTVTFLPEKSGALRYGCGMGMMVSGVLLVD